MPNLLERITGRPSRTTLQQQLQAQANETNLIAQQLQSMQAGVNDLVHQNGVLQSLLNVNFRMQGGFTKYDYSNQITYIRDGYNISSSVYSIVRRIAKTAAQVPLCVYEVKDEKALKEYKRITSDNKWMLDGESRYKALQLQKKALEEVGQDDPLQKLIDNPSQEYQRSTFYEMVVGFDLLCGNSYIYMPVLDGGANKGTVPEMFIMPSQFTAIVITAGWPQKCIGYELIMNGVTLMRSNEVLHLRYPNYDWAIDGQQFYGYPPLRAALRTLKRSNSAETSATAQFENGGPAVIVANKSISSDNYSLEQVSKSKQTNQNEYAGNTNRGKVRYMAGDISAIPLGLSPVDLNILEEEQWSFAMLCNVWGVSDTLFNNHSASTESNVKEMRKDFYTNAVLPEVYNIRDGFNQRLTPLYTKKGVRKYVDVDITGISELQPDMQSMTTWLNTAWWLTPNQKLEMQKFGRSDDPNMDKIWLPQNMVMMDDIVLPDINDDGTEPPAPQEIPE